MTGRSASSTRSRPGPGIVIRHERSITVDPDGGFGITERVEIPPAITDLARVGIVLETVPGLEAVRWFGSGPHETYPDRRRGGIVAVHESTVTDQTVPYIRPQENGGHADVRWLELTDPSTGEGIRLVLDTPGQVSATHHRAADLAAATHHPELVPRPETIVHLDAAHRGLGTASCGPDTLPGYLVGPGRYEWSWHAPHGAGRGRMTVEWRPDGRQFHLANGSVSCVLRVADDDALLLLHLGAPLPLGRDYGHLAPTPDPRHGERVGDPVPFAYPTAGTGDFRIPALLARGPDGATTAPAALRLARGRRREAGAAGPAVDLRRVPGRGGHADRHARRRPDRPDRRPALDAVSRPTDRHPQRDDPGDDDRPRPRHGR